MHTDRSIRIEECYQEPAFQLSGQFVVQPVAARVIDGLY